MNIKKRVYIDKHMQEQQNQQMGTRKQDTLACGLKTQRCVSGRSALIHFPGPCMERVNSFKSTLNAQRKKKKKKARSLHAIGYYALRYGLMQRFVWIYIILILFFSEERTRTFILFGSFFSSVSFCFCFWPPERICVKKCLAAY